MLIGMTEAKEELEIMKSYKGLPEGDCFIPEMELFILKGEVTIEALENATSELKNEINQMIEYLGQDPRSRAEDIFGALSTFKSSLEVSYLHFFVFVCWSIFDIEDDSWVKQRAVEDVVDWEEEEELNDDVLEHPKSDVNITSAANILAAIDQEHKTPSRHSKDRSLTSSISSTRKLLFGKGGLDTAVRDLRSGGSILRNGSMTSRHRHLRDEISPTRNQSPGSKIFLTK
ncbi:hypothetical protein DFH28DRAFT_964973 [Melampsora americana]|nr:hypothetical protein DFH28DRAFT_964973 [Melampsora americana]